MISLYARIAVLAKNAPTKIVLISCDHDGSPVETTTNQELLEKIEAAAAFLCAQGLKRGDRVALAFDNPVEFLILSWAAWSMGICTVPLDSKRDTEALRTYKVTASGSKRILTRIDFIRPANPIPWMPDLSHEALILFTSGTTALPKGAVLTLQNLATNADGIREWLHIRENDRFLACLPLHHINSTTFCLTVLLAGGSIAIPPSYSNSRFWQQAARTEATLTSIVQSILYDQLQQKEAFATVQKHLKLSRIQIGSAPVVAEDMQAFMQEFHVPLYQGYGQTETALRVTGVPMNLPKAVYEKLVEENSIGTAMPWAEIEIANERGEILGEGEEGELMVKGAAVMEGYVAHEPAFRNGYFLTGDIGFYRTIEGTRYFFLKGRKKEILIKGGVNISPLAVEYVLRKTLKDIQQVYVVGVEDKRYGEEVGAVICLKEGTTPNEAKRRIKTALLFGDTPLSRYERPRYIVILAPENLPVTSTGKVQRTKLKEIIGRDRFESVYDLFKTDDYRFTLLEPRSLYSEASRALYNHCWQPLTQTPGEYAEYLKKNFTLAAIDTRNEIAGQISFVITDRTVTCVSICSAAFIPKLVPEAVSSPSPETVRRYVLEGHDPVMNFHRKLGAEFREVIQNGRPEDKSSCGYTMLLSYPPLSRATLQGSVSEQLITAVRQIADDLGANVYALSRPGGLAAYMHKNSVV